MPFLYYQSQICKANFRFITVFVIVYNFQKLGVNKTKTVKSSNLPSNMEKQIVHFAASGRDEKLPVGPITSPKPGPTLLIDVAAPETAVIKSNPLIDNRVVIIKKIINSGVRCPKKKSL